MTPPSITTPSPLSPLRVPVISFKAGLLEAVQRRLLATQSSLASERLRAGTLELVAIPLPKFSTATNDPTSNQNEALDDPAETLWELTPEQESVLAEAVIVLADAHHSAPLLLDGAKRLPRDKQHLLKNVQWVQATYAGVDAYLKLLLAQDVAASRADSDASKPIVASPSFTLTRAGAIKGMAQYVFGWIITLERKFFEAKAFQEQLLYAKAELTFRSYKSLTVGVLGFGAIGQAIGRLLKVAGFQVTGFRRRQPAASNGDDGDDDKARAMQSCAHRISTDLEDVLQTSDYVVSILPSTPATKCLLTVDVLAACAVRQPVLISVGRGDVVAESTLLLALERGYLSKVVLDVFEREPLRPESVLWRHPRVHLTPHVSAKCFVDDVADVFVDNLNAFLTGAPMNYTVDWASGY